MSMISTFLHHINVIRAVFSVCCAKSQCAENVCTVEEGFELPLSECSSRQDSDSDELLISSFFALTRTTCEMSENMKIVICGPRMNTPVLRFHVCSIVGIERVAF